MSVRVNPDPMASDAPACACFRPSSSGETSILLTTGCNRCMQLVAEHDWRLVWCLDGHFTIEPPGTNGSLYCRDHFGGN
jgi:hypothetical protein